MSVSCRRAEHDCSMEGRTGLSDAQRRAFRTECQFPEGGQNMIDCNLLKGGQNRTVSCSKEGKKAFRARVMLLAAHAKKPTLGRV